MNNIKAIIFDLGGILVPEKDDQIKKEICEFLGIPNNQLSIFLERYVKKLTKGEISLLSYYKYLVKEFKLIKSANQILEKHIELYIKYCTRRNKRIISLIQKLKENYKIVALTNTEIEIAKYNKKNGLYEYFEKTYISTEMHLMKPQSEMYLKVLEDLRDKPDDTIFIDNKIEYVEAAKNFGINVIHFKSSNQLEKDFKKFGINLK